MKNGKKPTRKQKMAIEKAKLKVEEWLVSKVLANQLEIVHKVNSKTRLINS